MESVFVVIHFSYVLFLSLHWYNTEDCFTIAERCLKSVCYQELHCCIPYIIQSTNLVWSYYLLLFLFCFFYCIGLQSFFRYLLMKYSTSCILVGKCIDIPLFNVDCPMSFIFLNVKNWLSYSVHTPDRSLVNRAWENYMLVVSKYIKKLISM